MQTFVESFARDLPQYSDRARLALELIREQRAEREAARLEPAPAPPAAP